MHFREPGVVDLKDEARINDRLVLAPERLAEGLQVLFVAAVILVAANATRRHGRHESFLDFHPTERGFEILNVFPDRLLSPIADRRRTHERGARRDTASHHAPAKVLFIVFRKGGHLRSPLLPTCGLRGLRFKAGETLANVSEKSGLPLLAVGHNVDPTLTLLADNLSHGGLNPLTVGGFVIRLAVDFCLHQIEQLLRTRENTAVSGYNAMGAPFHVR